MRFADLKGNTEVVKALAGMIDSGKIPHAIMFHENDGGGAMALVQAFLQNLLCRHRQDSDACGQCPTCNKVSKMIHPDVRYVFPVTSGAKVSAAEKPTSLSYAKEWRELVLSNPFFTEDDLSEALEIEGKSALISVVEARSVLDMLSLHSLEGGYRAVVVYLPEKMNQEAANRLLKAIEEPPQKTEFLLITHAPEKVLQTIASRCQRIRLLPMGHAEVSVAASENAQQDAELFGSLMQALLAHNLLDALDVADALAALPSRERAKGFCKYAGDQLRTLFLLQQGVGGALVPDASPELAAWASACRKTFPRAAQQAVDRAYSLIDRNVNMKILFTDLIDRLSLII